jgi:hypothetical protein
VFAGGVALLLVGGAVPRVDAPSPIGATPSPRQLAWHELQFYGFVHFTVNTFTDKEWGYGDEPESVFNPTAFDARQWVQVARDAGMTGLILTAKHHDGFCLWSSRFTRHSVAASAWRDGRGDVVGVGRERDRGRMLVEEEVERRSRGVPAGVAGEHDGAIERLAEPGVRGHREHAAMVRAGPRGVDPANAG